MSLFGTPPDDRKLDRPLSDRMRPETLEDFLGQGHLLGEGHALRQAIEEGKTGSLILFGPPGVGKTTLALLIAKASGLDFTPFSAVLSGVKDVRQAVASADALREAEGLGTMLFVDEIHRFNKAQQDAFLPYVESGRVVLVGATTENPAFSIIGPLLSRCRVLQLHPLSPEDVGKVADRALVDKERGLGCRRLSLTPDARERLTLLAGGDARRALTVIEAVAAVCKDGSSIDVDMVTDAMQHRALLHDKAGDLHYDLLSAFHKSLRNSDVQASVYWLARLLEAGADPLQPARRMVAMAAEDIGLAAPMALQIAISAMQAVQNLGLPEGRLPLTEAAIYLASAPKSNAVLRAIDQAIAEVQKGQQWPVPLQLRNAPTALAKEFGHGKGYRYAHDYEGATTSMACLPEALLGRRFYEPSDRGFEKNIRERMEGVVAPEGESRARPEAGSGEPPGEKS